MNWKKKLPLIVMIAGIVSFIGAVLLFALAVPRADAAYKRVLEIILASLMLLLSLLVVLYFYVTRDAEPNFFLFDRKRKRNIPLEKLTFKIVNERMTFYLSMVCDGSVEQRWTENALENDRQLGPHRVYRPLLAYKMLYDLADKDLESDWALLYSAKPEIVNSLCSALEQGGEREIVRAFRYVMDSYRETPAKIRDFICGNQKYFCGRMVKYITKNIELFY